jgi:hypothetical protein
MASLKLPSHPLSNINGGWPLLPASIPAVPALLDSYLFPSLSSYPSDPILALLSLLIRRLAATADEESQSFQLEVERLRSEIPNDRAWLEVVASGEQEGWPGEEWKGLVRACCQEEGEMRDALDGIEAFWDGPSCSSRLREIEEEKERKANN